MLFVACSGLCARSVCVCVLGFVWVCLSACLCIGVCVGMFFCQYLCVVVFVSVFMCVCLCVSMLVLLVLCVSVSRVLDFLFVFAICRCMWKSVCVYVFVGSIGVFVFGLCNV